MLYIRYLIYLAHVQESGYKVMKREFYSTFTKYSLDYRKISNDNKKL